MGQAGEETNQNGKGDKSPMSQQNCSPAQHRCRNGTTIRRRAVDIRVTGEGQRRTTTINSNTDDTAGNGRVPSVEMVDTDVQIPSTLLMKTNKPSPCRQHPRHAVTSWRHHRLQSAPVPLVLTMVIHMFDELRRRHVWTEEELQRQRRSNAFLRKQLKAHRDRSTSLERSASSCRQRKALSDVTNNQHEDNRVSAANDLLITLDAGISFKARETLKRSFAGQGHDVWAPTWAVKRLKAELAEGANFEWVSEEQTRALVCTDVRAMVEGRLQELANSGGDIYKILNHENFASFTAPIPPGPLKFWLMDAMNDLRHIYRLSRAKILHPEDLNSLEHWTKMFYCHWQQLRTIDASRYPVRPKLHLLSAHVVPFARSHLWWGLISEQGMEHMHRMSNNLVGCYSHLGTQEKIVEKLVKHTTMLNALHDRGVENNKENDKYPDFLPHFHLTFIFFTFSKNLMV